MGTLTFTHTSTGSEPKPGLIESYVIQNWTGTFTFSINASAAPGGDIYNIDWRLVRSSDGLVCFASSSTMSSINLGYSELWNVGVTGSWAATDWDRFELRYGTASDRVDAGIVLTAVFDGAGITGGGGGTTSSMALVYKLSTTTLDRDLDERYIPKAIMTTKGDVIVGAAATNPVRLGVGTDGYVLTSRSSDSNGVAWEAASGGGGGGALTTSSAILASDVAISAIQTWYTALSLTLAAGTWLLWGQVLVQDNGGSTAMVSRLNSGSTVYASTYGPVAGGGDSNQANIQALVVLAASTTITLQAAMWNATGAIQAAVPLLGQGNNATQFMAVKVA